MPLSHVRQPAFVMTRANIQDRDGGYAGRVVTWAKQLMALTVKVVKRADKTLRFLLLLRRWVVERTFDRIAATEDVSRLPTLPEHNKAMVHIAIIVTAGHLARTGNR